jgi:hypothetical protein
MKRPSFQFYPADWRKDAALQSCSVAARGLWMEMMCIAHECEPYGHLTVNGKAMTCAQIARLVGLGERECGKLLKELQDAGVSSVAEDGSIFSRRMVRDEDLRQRRADAGKAGSEFGILGAEHGRKGGRPRKDRGDEKPPLKPSPSSSSSSSSSSSPSGDNPKPLCTLAQAKSYAPNVGMTPEEAEHWWHARNANGWMKGTGGGGHPIRIASFQSDMKQSLTWVRESMAKANGTRPPQKRELRSSDISL